MTNAGVSELTITYVDQADTYMNAPKEESDSAVHPEWTALRWTLLDALNEMTGVGTTPTIEDEYNITTIRDINKQLLNQIAVLGEWQALVADMKDIGAIFANEALVGGGETIQSYHSNLLALGMQQKATHLLDGGFNPQYLAQQPTIGKKQDEVEIV
jgi:hypothetical protein